MANMRTRKSTLGLITGLLISLAAPAMAQEEVPVGGDVVPAGPPPREQTYETARGVSMGGGARASATGTSAIAYNPANLGLAPVYHIETMVGFVPNARTWLYGGAVADAVSNRIAAGMSFYGYHGNEDRNYGGFDGRLSLGLAITQALGIGISGRYIKLESDEENEDGEQVGGGIRAFTVDAALRLTAFEGLQIAAFGYNLIPTDSGFAPLQVGGAISYSYKTTFSINLDMLVDLSTFDEPMVIFGAGAEYLAGSTVPLRVGFRRDWGRDINQITAGIGYVDTKFGVDLGLRQDLGGGDTQLLLSARYHVQ